MSIWARAISGAETSDIGDSALSPVVRLPADLPADRWWQVVQGVLDGGPPVHPLPDHPVSLASDDRLLEGSAVALGTSGSTGTPKIVVLDAPALLASASATLERLGGPGQWLQALSPAHVAGWQVWVRSVLADVPPVVLPRREGFDVPMFVEAVARMQRGVRRYVALVPTQVHRLLADPAGCAALQSFDAVLVGGAALPADQRARLDRLAVVVVTTYGGTETSGGCLYEGTPLRDVEVRTGQQGQILLAGPMLARGYLGDPAHSSACFVHRDGRRWFVSADVGEQRPDGSWRVLGRIDDVISTGGHKVHPALVEEALVAVPAVEQAVVVGLPDPEWGQRVVAVVVPDRTAAGTDLDGLHHNPTRWVRDRLRGGIPGPGLPREVHLVAQLPILPGGKVDRATALGLLADPGGTMGDSDPPDT